MAEPQRRMLGAITIGQAPRDDMMPQIAPFLPAGLEIRQMGALDGLTSPQLANLAPGPDDYVLHTRLRDGSGVTIARERIVSLMQARIAALEEAGAEAILLLCTGEFPELRSKILLIEPDRLLFNVVRGLPARRIGVFVPLQSQFDIFLAKWGPLEVEVIFAAASPYREPTEVAEAARALPAGLDLIVMDCMGYTRTHKQLVRQATGSPIILAASVVARVVGELVD